VAAWRFFCSRAFRIYPAVFASVLLFAVVRSFATPELLTLRNILMNMLLLDVSLNGVMWSLQVEMIAIIPIFMAFLLYRRWGVSAVLLLFGILVALSFTGRHMHWGNIDLTQLFSFIAGMLAYYIWRPDWRILESVWACAGALLALLFARLLLGFSSHWAVVIEGILAAVFLGFLAYGRLGWYAGLFDNCVVRFYGRLSYSLYLLHPLTLLVIWNMPDVLGVLVLAGIPTPAVAFGLTVISVVAITPLAWLSYHYVERQGVVLSHQVTGRPPRQPQPDTAL
jgi:peptidoglycan/LPS O-acetylase OafA/YrhL